MNMTDGIVIGFVAVFLWNIVHRFIPCRKEHTKNIFRTYKKEGTENE